MHASKHNNEQEMMIMTRLCHNNLPTRILSCSIYIHVHNAIAMQCRDMQSLLVGCMHAHDKIARGQKVGTVSTQLTYGSIVII